MRILSIEPISRFDLLAAIKETRLRGYDGAQPYLQASLEIDTVDTDTLVPAQNYVLAPGVAKILELRTAVLAEGVDIFTLAGGLYVTTSDDENERIPVIPPIVEESVERDGRTVLLINDGMHRVFAARSLGLPISVVVARNVAPEYPYYAYALDEGWSQVTSLTELPDSYQKKEYRRPANYKSLFREFNALFPGVQKERKQSNPSHLLM